jgi:hypothetical protein
MYMKKCRLIFMMWTVGLSACAAVYTDGSDANQVTFLNSNGESIAQLTPKANAYCAQYGKVAQFRNSDSLLVAIFDCNLAH